MKVRDIVDGRIDENGLLRTSPSIDAAYERSRLTPGDVLVTIRGTTGRVALVPPQLAGANITQDTARVRFQEGLDPRFCFYSLQSEAAQHQIALHTIGQAVTGINIRDLRNLAILTPPTLAEQSAIAECLSDVGALLGALEALIAKKRAIKQAAMQQLLTGKTRLPGFGGEWKKKRIADIANPCSDKNHSSERLPVLTCSKHLGFVDSLGFFKNQVFSKDLSGYRIVRRGQIGYPANHIEEGSIGLQDLYEVALVSPIYVVFQPVEHVDSFFLHRLLKLDSYRQVFATATNSSVDRRGSLRWSAFSDIAVTLPPLEEQTAIATVLSDMDAEISALEARRDKIRAIKQGMMQQLLTGRVRLVQPEVPSTA